MVWISDIKPWLNKKAMWNPIVNHIYTFTYLFVIWCEFHMISMKWINGQEICVNSIYWTCISSREIYVVFALKYHKYRVKTKAFEVRKSIFFLFYFSTGRNDRTLPHYDVVHHSALRGFFCVFLLFFSFSFLLFSFPFFLSFFFLFFSIFGVRSCPAQPAVTV